MSRAAGDPGAPIHRPFDVGLQVERTALSWQRTTLSFAVASLAAAKLLIVFVGVLGELVAVAGIVCTCILFAIGHRRYRTTHMILVESSGERVGLASAVPLFVWAGLVLGLGVFALAFVVYLAAR